MIGIEDALIFGKAGISLIPGIVDVVKKVRSTNPEPSLQRVIDQLITDTREQCKRLSDETRLLQVSLTDLSGGKDKKLSELYEDVGLLNFPRKNSIKKHKEALRNIHNALSSSVDDIVSVLICTGKAKDLKQASEITQAVRKDLDGLISSSEEKTVGQILDVYRKTIDHWVKELS